MIIIQYIPNWLRSRLRKPALQKPKTVNKKDRQLIPTVEKPKRAPNPSQDGYRLLWRI